MSVVRIKNEHAANGSAVDVPYRRFGSLCRETHGRDILAALVHEEWRTAMRIGLYDEPRSVNGAKARTRRSRRNG